MHLRGAENIGESITMMDLHKAGLTALGPKGMSPSLLVANLWIWRGERRAKKAGIATVSATSSCTQCVLCQKSLQDGAPQNLTQGTQDPAMSPQLSRVHD